MDLRAELQCVAACRHGADLSTTAGEVGVRVTEEIAELIDRLGRDGLYLVGWIEIAGKRIEIGGQRG